MPHYKSSLTPEEFSRIAEQLESLAFRARGLTSRMVGSVQVTNLTGTRRAIAAITKLVAAVEIELQDHS